MNSKNIKKQFLSSKSSAIDTIEDELILKRSLSNPSFFSVLVDRYQDGFLRSAYRVVRSREEAEDITQEAFTKIYFNAKKFKKQPGASFKSWAYRILMNTAFTRYRKLKKKAVNLEEFFDVILYEDAKTDHKERKKNLEQREIIENALEDLPEGLAELLRLHYFKGLSYKDISAVTDISLSTIKMRLYRARQILKEKLT